MWDAILVGASPASLVLGLRLSAAGCRCLMLLPAKASNLDLERPEVLWPGLGEHWGVLRASLGLEQSQGLLHLLIESRNGLLGDPDFLLADGRRGAVLQLAREQAEMDELCLHLDWVNRLWSRRLMASGSASNYLPLEELAGAAFVSDCCRFDGQRLQRAWLERLQLQGVEVVVTPGPLRAGELHSGVEVRASDARWQGELLFLSAGHRSLEYLSMERRWLFPLRGVWMGLGKRDRRGLDWPWNQALVGVEAYRGHLMVGTGQQGWWLSGLSPASGWEALTDSDQLDLGLVAQLKGLAGALMTDFCECQEERLETRTFTFSADGLPLVGPLPGSSRTWVMAGMGSRSWSLGPGLGEWVARAILGEDTPLTGLTCLRPSRWLDGKAA